MEGKKLHDVSTRFQQRSGVSLHENVPEFDEARGSSQSYPIHFLLVIKYESNLGRMYVKANAQRTKSMGLVASAPFPASASPT